VLKGEGSVVVSKKRGYHQGLKLAVGKEEEEEEEEAVAEAVLWLKI